MRDPNGLSNLVPWAKRYKDRGPIKLFDGRGFQEFHLSPTSNFKKKEESILEMFGMHLVLHTIWNSSGHILVKSGRELIPSHPKLSKVVAFCH
jgi:hypothetical protein